MKIKIILTSLIFILLLSINVFAANSTIIILSSRECYAGETITLSLSFTQNSGFANARVSVVYDEDIFTLVGAAKDKNLFSGDFHSDRLKSPYNLSWESSSYSQNYYAEGVAAELTFKVSPTAKNGKYEIQVVVMSDGLISADGSIVDVQCINSSVFIVQDPDNCYHSWGNWTSSSLIQHKHICANCGQVEYDSHEWDDGEITKEPTEESTGKITYTCDTCGATKLESIPALEPEIKEYTVSGTVTSYGSSTDSVTLRLLDGSSQEITKTTSTNGSYSLSVPDGTYTLEVSKKNHVTRKYTVTVNGGSVTQNVKIHLLGDLSGDGRVRSNDLTLAYNHVNGSKPITDSYIFACGEITGDGKIRSNDITKIYGHVSGSALLW